MMEQAGSEPIRGLRWGQLGIDAGVVFAGYLATLVLRFDGKVPDKYWQHFFWFVPIVILTHLAANRATGTYEANRMPIGKEARRLFWAGLATMLLLAVVSDFVSAGLLPLPLSVLALGAAVSVLGFELTRFGRHIRFQFPS